jgi:hypothetical protein
MVYYCSWFEVFKKKTLDFASDKDAPNDFMIPNFLKIRSCMSNTDMLYIS